MSDEALIVLLLAQIVLIVMVSRLLGALFARVRQPQVIGEMLAGILLGPSVLGLLSPYLFHLIFPANGGHGLQYIHVLSQVGVIFFLFLVGLELDPGVLKGGGRATAVISITSLAAPFALGAGMTALLMSLKPELFAGTGTATAAIVFMGAAMSTTAFPVMARILTERNLHKSKVGTIAITCAALNDVLAWCMLAAVAAIARAKGLEQAGWVAAFTLLYVAAMQFLARPLVQRIEILYDRQGRLSQNLVAVIFMLILVSAYTTQQIGIHALFGAFMMGFIMPKGTRFVRHLSEKMEDYTLVLFLPLFFAYTGLNTRLDLISSPALWGVTLLIIAIACIGKFGASALAARWMGMTGRESAAIGILLNTRGLVELIILTVGRDLHVISDQVFAMMVVMALVTTALTAPLLHLFHPAKPLGAGAAPRSEKYSILIPVALPKSGGPLVQLADTLMESDRRASRLYAVHLRKPVSHETYRSGLDEADMPHDESLAPLLAQARGRGIAVEPISLVSQDVPSDICELAAGRHVNLVLMGFHKPVIGKTILGGTVHRVLTNCSTHVAVLVDRGFRDARRIMVPYLGSNHDRLALELACRMARNTGARVTVLHITAPIRGGDPERKSSARDAVDRVFHDPASPTPVTFRVVEDPSPVGVVLHQAQNFDLIVIGVAEEWGLESHLFGWRAQRIARDCPCSLLIVRKHGDTPVVIASTPAQEPTSQGAPSIDIPSPAAPLAENPAAQPAVASAVGESAAAAPEAISPLPDNETVPT